MKEDAVPGEARASDSRDGETRGSRVLARVLDDAVRIPGTRRRVGLDVLLGLVPGYGDATATAIGSAIVLQAARAGVPGRILLIMACNQLLNGVLGAVPVAGDVFSAFFKSNARNYRLLQQWQGSADRSRLGRAIIWTAVALLAVLTMVLVTLAWLAASQVVIPLWQALQALPG